MAGSLKYWWTMMLSISSTDGTRSAWARLRLNVMPLRSRSRFLCQLRKWISSCPEGVFLQKKRMPSKQRQDA